MFPKELKKYQRDVVFLKSLLTKSPTEDWNIITQIEKILITKRNGILKFPTPGTPVIILATGGIDSTINTLILLKFFKLELYPLFINWGQKNLVQETKAFKFFINYFSAHYPQLYHQPKFIEAHHPAREIFNSRSNIVTLRNTTFCNHAVTYAKFLEETSGLKIRNVFLNTVASDSPDCPDTSLTAVRATNLNICTNEDDYSWQIISLAIEKELGFYLDKKETIAIAVANKLPLERTWTCYQGGDYQCGSCFTCWARKIGFEKAGVHDKTIYYEQTKNYRLKHFLDELRLKIVYKLTHF